ncbi:MAG: hypothetical protein LBG07_11545 [Treponema sp.]|jgi:tetratricopeptide (TPR) repeat protein|nr:hypothetical protein [Treponema sp.]
MTRILSRKLLFGLCVFLPWVSCAGEEGAGEEREYGEIIDSGALGEELIAALEDFEIRHGGHFDSKLDLGIYYLALGETERARDYLRRAERILLDGGGKTVSRKEAYAPALYGALAQVSLVRKEYQAALEYIDRAIAAEGGDERRFHFLKGHILVAGREYREALDIFDELLAGSSGGLGDAGEEDLRAYMFLLAQAERPVEAAAALDRYFSTGAFFPGLGYFGAALYRAAGEMEKAACAAFLEGEYRSGYGGFQEPGGLESPAGEMIPVPDGGRGGEGEAEHFAAEYLRLKNLINGGENFTKDEFLRLTGLEPCFRLFPSFYWQLWMGARLAYPDDYQYFSAALQKIIALDKEGPFAKRAWEELTSLMGY